MKTITLQDFHAEVKKLAAKKKRTYSTVDVNLSEHSYTDGTSRPTIYFRCYVDGYGFHDGKTPAEALSKLRASMFPVKHAIPVVEVEI